MTKKLHYLYKVKDEAGKTKIGKATATNLAELRKLLANKGYTIISINEEKRGLRRFNFNGINPRERSIMYRELATMLKAGISITQAIEIIADTPNKKVKKVLTEILDGLENGFPLSTTMAGQGKIFPAVEIGVIKAGEATGNLSQVLLELARSTARSAEFNAKVRGALIYPAFVMVVMVVIGVIIMTKVIPPIKEIFVSAGVDLPLPTRILLGVTDFFSAYWPYIILVIILIAFLIRLFSRTKKGKRVTSQLILNFPIFGKLLQEVFLARFNRTLSLLVGAGVPIIEAVEIIESSTSDVTFRKALQQLTHALEQGSAIATSLKTNKYFPKLMTQLLYVGQQSGDLAGTAKTLADYYESEVDQKLQTLSALLEPFIIIILGFAVGFVIVSVLQPIYSLTGVF
jgi:type IV pilus assembly protein PilC